MGRPKKLTDEVPDNVGNLVTTPELNDVAVSMVFDGEKYTAIEIPFDFKTGTVGEMKQVETNQDRDVIITRFEVLTGRIIGWNY